MARPMFTKAGIYWRKKTEEADSSNRADIREA